MLFHPGASSTDCSATTCPDQRRSHRPNRTVRYGRHCPSSFLDGAAPGGVHRSACSQTDHDRQSVRTHRVETDAALFAVEPYVHAALPRHHMAMLVVLGVLASIRLFGEGSVWPRQGRAEEITTIRGSVATSSETKRLFIIQIVIALVVALNATVLLIVQPRPQTAGRIESITRAERSSGRSPCH